MEAEAEAAKARCAALEAEVVALEQRIAERDAEDEAGKHPPREIL